MMRTAKISLLFSLLALLSAACGGAQTPDPGPVVVPPPAEDERAQVRFINAVTDGQPVDAYVADTLVGENIGYSQWDDWIDIRSGEQDVLLRTGEVIQLNDVYTFEPGERYLILAYGAYSPVHNNTPLMLMIHPEEDVDEAEEDTFIRFTNVIPDGDAYGFVVTTDGGWSLLFPRQDVGTISEYKHGPVYANSFELIPARNTSLPAVYSWEDNLQLGTLYTFIATGRIGNGTVQVFAVTDAQSLRD